MPIEQDFIEAIRKKVKISVELEPTRRIVTIEAHFLGRDILNDKLICIGWVNYDAENSYWKTFKIETMTVIEVTSESFERRGDYENNLENIDVLAELD